MTASGTLTPSGTASLMYIARPGGENTITLVLRRAASATSRFIMARLDSNGRVFIQPQAGQTIEATRRPDGRVLLNNQQDYATFVTDGVAWYVFAER